MKFEPLNKINKDVAKYSRIIGPEGMVLLRNNNDVLPLIKDKDKVAIFGRCQINLYRSGTGSGGSVNVPYTVNLIEGMNNTSINYDKELYEIYKNWIKDHPFDNGGNKWANEPWNQEEMDIDDNICFAASTRCNKAIIVIGRTAGEDKDYSYSKGSYLLTDTEQKLINTVTKYFSKTIVLMNVSNIIDINFINNKDYVHPISSVLYCWQGGMETGNAICDALLGTNPPSGKLSDTIAYSIDDYFSNKNFGNTYENIYKEDIYVGYRYFNTFAKDKVMFPFGYGLTYTKFDLKCIYANYDKNTNKVNIEIEVTNVGNKYASKEVVQIYLKAPFDKLSRPDFELISFKKTKLLKPNQKQILTFSIDVNKLACFDDIGLTKYKSAYVLQKGTYEFYYGNSSFDLNKFQFENEFIVEDDVCIKQLKPLMENSVVFDRITRKPNSSRILYEKVDVNESNLKQRMNENLPKSIKQIGYKGIKLKDVNNKNEMKKFLSQFTNEELATLVRGEGMCSPKATLGLASCFGGVSESLIEKYGLPLVSCSDGPSGIRMDVGSLASQVPIGTLLSCTFNEKLVEKLFTCESEELQNYNIDFLLGPGINIHRHPLNGRNFEYFSEDPLLAGKIASSVVKGINKYAFATIKHMACNNQEYERNNVNAIVSQRALREIYLKPFEICVKEGKCKSIMTSYNPINGFYSSSNYDMLTEILRKEWKFDGIVMTDWWALINDCIYKGEGNRQDLTSMIKAQNDLYMVVDNYDAEINKSYDNIIKSLNNGKLSLGELQRSCLNICNILHYILKCRNKEISCMQSINPIDINDINRIEGSEYKQKGVYCLYVSYEPTTTDGCMAKTNIYLNEKMIGNIQTNNSDRIETKKALICKVNLLNDGNYKLEFDEFAKGIKIVSYELVKENK